MTEKIEIYLNESSNLAAEQLDLGRVEMGKTMKYSVFVKNPDEEWPLDNITVESGNEELRFELPKIIKPLEMVEAFIFWTPKKGSRKPLLTEFKISDIRRVNGGLDG